MLAPYGFRGPSVLKALRLYQNCWRPACAKGFESTSRAGQIGGGAARRPSQTNFKQSHLLMKNGRDTGLGRPDGARATAGTNPKREHQKTHVGHCRRKTDRQRSQIQLEARVGMGNA